MRVYHATNKQLVMVNIIAFNITPKEKHWEIILMLITKHLNYYIMDVISLLPPPPPPLLISRFQRLNILFHVG